MTKDTTPTSGAADLRTAAQAVVDRWDTPLWKDVPSTAEYIGRLRAALAAGQAIELIGAPTDERMRAVRRVLRGAVIVAEDDGKVAPLPGAVYAELPEPDLFADCDSEGGFLGDTSDVRVLNTALFRERSMRDFADRTHALRASHGQAPAGATEMENLQRTAVGWQERALRAERNWVVCRRWAIAGGAPVEKLGDSPDPPFHAALAAGQATAAPAQPAAQQPHRSGCTAGTDEACVQRGCGINCIAVSPPADNKKKDPL